MSVKLTDTQLVLLSAASQREDHYLTLPSGARLAPARKAASKLLAGGFVREVRSRGQAPVWRRDEETELAFALKLTAAGLKAISAGSEDGVNAPANSLGVGTPPTTRAPDPVDANQDAEQLKACASPVAPRSGTRTREGGSSVYRLTWPSQPGV